MRVIEVENLAKSYGGVSALTDLSFGCLEASTLAVLGPNGAGKTTAVKILATLLRADGGQAFVDGIDVAAHPREVRARIGLTGQYAAVDERLTGRENLELVGRLLRLGSKESAARAADLLTQLRLSDASDRVSKGYSGGMRRRLDIAMSLIGRPSVLFLDEPTTGLDPRSRLEMWDLIDDLVRGGTTMLLTTQYLDEADRLADSIVVIDHGHAIATGTAEQLKQDIGGDRVVLTLSEPSQRAAAASAMSPFAVAAPRDGDHDAELIIPVKPTTTLVEVLRCLDRASVGVDDIEMRRPTLDDVFFRLTGSTTSQETVDDDR